MPGGLFCSSGDIVTILDSTGTAVVQYKHDAWGNPISKTGSMASTLGTVQPFRYRGYVYDEETGLYYLRSRYYNSGYARFLNADGYLWDKNIFAYCQNNAVNRVDNNGNASFSCIGDVTEDPVGGYYVDLSMAGNSSLWHSPLLNGEWSGYFVQTPYIYSLDHLPLPQGKTATPEMLKNIATDAAHKYIQNNPGKGAVHGTKGHTFVEALIKEQNWSNVQVEVSYKDRFPAEYGTSGSIRLDAVLFDSNGLPSYAIDLKFGISPLTQRRIDQINKHLPNPIQIDQVP